MGLSLCTALCFVLLAIAVRLAGGRRQVISKTVFEGIEEALREMPPLEPGMMPPMGGDACVALKEFASNLLQRPIMYDMLNNYKRQMLINSLQRLIKISAMKFDKPRREQTKYQNCIRLRALVYRLGQTPGVHHPVIEDRISTGHLIIPSFQGGSQFPVYVARPPDFPPIQRASPFGPPGVILSPLKPIPL